MLSADLSRTAHLAAMQGLDLGLTEVPAPPSEAGALLVVPTTVLAAAMAAGVEAAGHEPTTPAQAFEGREGYSPGFLDGWPIPLPQPVGARATDARPLRRGGQGTELKYEHFSVIISKSRRMPMLTASNIDASQSRRLPRIDTWSFDGRLDKDDQLGDALYQNNDLDRGHMVRREDPVWGTLETAKQANIDTFHFTNACPQMKNINQQVWLGLENYVLNHARTDHMKVSVFTGPFFGKNDLFFRGALIPLAFWKVVAIVTEDGRPSATAYRVGQEQDLAQLEFVFGAYQTFQISVKQVMDSTGLDFGALVPFDGFSAEEAATGQQQSKQLESLLDVRV